MPWLLVCSYLFYLYEPSNLGFVVLLASATLVTYCAALAVEKLPKGLLRRLFLFAAMLVSLGSLIFYKYFGFITEISTKFVNMLGFNLQAPAFSVAVPLGISYFTFMALGYVIDVYKGKIKAERNFFHYALFVSFFPCIVTGPIERAENILPQFKKPAKFEYNRVAGGAFRILWGFFKKLVIAGNIGTIVTLIYKNPDKYPGPMLFLASVLFTYQLYCDFSACSDIAIGCGAVFGIKIMENFRRPLAAASFNDLWRRWHISLTNWFRDYMYIPLGGNRKGKLRTYLNQMIVFMASGLWHGASAAYIFWGFLNGIYLCIGKLTAPAREKLALKNPLYHFKPVKYIIQNTITYLLFTSCIVFFCMALQGGNIKSAFAFYAQMWTGWDVLFNDFAVLFAKLVPGIIKQELAIMLVIAVPLVELLEYLLPVINERIMRVYFFIRWPLYYALFIAILLFGAFGKSEFIYQSY
ncbi:MAG: MBOAT family O-acyltransferase [Oscillospiraceae bacterium]